MSWSSDLILGVSLVSLLIVTAACQPPDPSELESQLAQLEAERDQYARELDNHARNMMFYRAAVNDVTSRLNSVAAGQERLEGLRIAVETPELRASGQLRYRDEILSTLEVIEKELTEARAKVSALEGERAGWSREAAEFGRLIQSREKEIRELKEELELALDEARDAKLALDKERARVGELSGRLDDADETIEQATAELRRLKQRNVWLLTKPQIRSLRRSGVLGERKGILFVADQRRPITAYKRKLTVAMSDARLSLGLGITKPEVRSAQKVDKKNHEFIRSGNGYVLKIDDPGRFWQLGWDLIVEVR